MALPHFKYLPDFLKSNFTVVSRNNIRKRKIKKILDGIKHSR